MTICLVLIVIESVSRLTIWVFDIPLPNHKLDGKIIDHAYPTSMTDYLGYEMRRNLTQPALKMWANGTVIYNVTYTLDEFGRRSVHQIYHGQSHLILFGCSFTFGEGLKDNETLQYELGSLLADYDIYNYAAPGYGPQHMLAILERGRLVNEVKPRNGIAVYVYTRTHIGRANGVSDASWLNGAPYYYLDEGGVLTQNGSFETGRPGTTQAYKRFERFKQRSSFLSLVNPRLPLWTSDSQIRLTYEIIARSKRLYEEQFEGKFYVVVWPSVSRHEPTERLVHLLEMNNITVFRYSQEDAEGLTIPGDGHPSAKANVRFAKYLARNLTQLKKQSRNTQS